jgi:ABC-type transport system involved in Fe-S cluster assembly fused permease/ATPase subunit
MNYITEMIQVGIKKLSSASFKHLHKLDLNYHKTSSKNTVFGINRALRSIDGGLRFLLGFFAQMAIEFLFLCGTLYFCCGKKYLFNMLVTFVAYTLFTNKYSENRIQQIKDKMNIDKRQEFYQNESIMNYETVKQFNNEALEKSRYETILDKLYSQAMIVQNSLTKLNIG